jgi:hypothetical protein
MSKNIKRGGRGREDASRSMASDGQKKKKKREGTTDNVSDTTWA